MAKVYQANEIKNVAMLGGSGKLYLSSASDISEGALRYVTCLPGVEIEGVDGDVLRNYGPAVEIKAKELKGVKPSSCKADEPFSVKAI